MRRFLRFLVVLSVFTMSPAMSSTNRTTITVYDTHPVAAEEGCSIQLKHFNTVQERWVMESRIHPNRRGDLAAMLILISAMTPCKPILAVAPGATANTVILSMVDLFSPTPGLTPKEFEFRIP